jgi:hypothetical protein
MSNDVQIERRPAITLAEWKMAVRATAGVRLAHSKASATNPKTNEVIEIGGVEGDAEIEIEGKWYPWRAKGSVVFRPGAPDKNLKSAVRQAARSIAERLSAQLVDDNGQQWAPIS